MTRWGHSRPVWKCVILSFVAHILLMGYAYGTRLMFEAPSVAKQDNPMRVNFVEEAGLSLEGDEQVDSSEKPWDQFVTHQALPEIDGLERPEIDSEVVIERTVDRAVEKPSSDAPEPDLATLPQPKQTPEVTSPKMLNDFQPESSELAPQEIEVARRGEGESALDTPEFETPEEFSRPDLAGDFAPQGTDSSKNEFAPIKSDNSFITDLVWV